MCGKCSRMEKRPLIEADITGRNPRQHVIKHCNHCKHKVGYRTVQLDDIPEQLRGLSTNVLSALRPLQAYVGRTQFANHGYQIKMTGFRFLWRPHTVQEQIASLESRSERKTALKAYKFLMKCSASSYKDWVDMHAKFLAAHPELDINQDWWSFQLPRRCIEDVGIECAYWPHLYPRTVDFKSMSNVFVDDTQVGSKSLQ